MRTDHENDPIFSRAAMDLRRAVPDSQGLNELLAALAARDAAGAESVAPDALADARSHRARWLLTSEFMVGALLAASLVIGFVAGWRIRGRTADDDFRRSDAAREVTTVTARDARPLDGRSDTVSSGTRVVNFVIVAPGARRVALVGEFNDWNATATPMARAGGGVWRVALSLSSGRHVYAFILDDDRWVTDPRAPIAPERWYGARRSVMLVGGVNQ